MRAGNLGRVSKKKVKDETGKRRPRSITEQHEDNRAEAEANGWEIVTEYEDAESASRFAKRERADWARLQDDIGHDLLDVITLWESSRGSREPEDWFAFMRRCRDHHVLIHVTTHGRSYDMTNPRDWKALAEDGVDNAYESEKTSLRVRRALATNAANGMPHGIVKYGFERIYDPRSGTLLGQRPAPEQAAVCAEIIRRAAAGEPVSVITADLESRKVPAPGERKVIRWLASGEPVIAKGVWHRRQVARIATSVEYIGKIRVNGELVDAQWPAIVDDAEFETVFWAAVHVLTAPSRKTTRPGRARHLLSYIMTCGECGSDVSADMPRKRMITSKYVCSSMHHHCTSVVMADADEFVTLAVHKRLTDPDLYKHLVAGNDEQVVRARAEAARLRAELDEWAAADISARAFAIREGKLLPLIESAEKRAAELSVPLALRELVTPGADIAARWEAMPVAARRDVIRLLFPGLRLMPGKGPARDRIANGRPEELDERADLLGA